MARAKKTCRVCLKPVAHLHEHMDTHNAVRQHRCDEPGCSYSATRTRSLYDHKMTHQPVLKCYVETCKSTFKSEPVRKQHMRKKHEWVIGAASNMEQSAELNKMYQRGSPSWTDYESTCVPDEFVEGSSRCGDFEQSDGESGFRPLSQSSGWDPYEGQSVEDNPYNSALPEFIVQHFVNPPHHGVNYLEGNVYHDTSQEAVHLINQYLPQPVLGNPSMNVEVKIAEPVGYSIYDTVTRNYVPLYAPKPRYSLVPMIQNWLSQNQNAQDGTP